MNDVNTVILDNGLEYIIINQVELNNNNYLILVNINDYKDFVIRKEVQDQLVGLNDKEELNNVLMTIFKKVGVI